MPHFSDDIFLGSAPTGLGLDSTLGDSSPMPLGVGPMGRIYIFDVVPLTSQAAGLAANQTPLAAGNLTLVAGTGVTTTVGVDGVTRYVLDTPRSVSISTAGATDESALTFTVYGYDLYGQAMTQAILGPNNNTVSTTKAFKSVTRISVSAATAGAISAGYSGALGIPVRVTDAAYIIHAGWNSTLADNAGTFVAAVTTDPATTSTGDVRGTYTTSPAPNGTRRLILAIAIPAIGSGPNATRLGALGVTQV